MDTAEARLHAVAAFAEKLAIQVSLEAGAGEAAAFLRRDLGARRVEVFAVGEGALRLLAEEGDGARTDPSRIEAVLRSKERAVAGALVVAPLLAGADVEGVLAVQDAGQDAGSLALLSLVASTLGLFFARRRLHATERELRKKEKEQKILFDAVPAMLWFKDTENRILRCNRMAAEQRGLTPELMEGRTTDELYPDEAAQYLADDLEVIRSEKPKLGIVELHAGQGAEKFWVRTDKVPYRDETGAVTGVVVFATDITPLKRAEEDLRAEKERLVVTLRSIADAVIATDEHGRVAILNPVAERLTGWTLDEARGQPLDSVLRLEPEGPRATLVSRAGAKRTVTASRAPIADGEHVVGEVVVLHDVTEVVRLEEELFKVAKMESIGLLAAGIAHDFNNILAAVAANASLARATLGPASSALPLLDEVERAVKQARELTLQLLTFAKGGAPARERAQVAELVRENATFALRGSSARLVLDFARELDAVDVDRGQFAQVVQNLVINAKQAMPEGGVVSIRADNVRLEGARARALGVAEGAYVRIRVEDTGAGIEREHLSKIFDPFFTTKSGGTGLGLTTTFSIVRRHEGAITCDSRLGAGTTFEIFLPSSRSAPRSPVVPARSPLVAEMLRVQGRALVMDDQKTVRGVLGRMLEHLGLETAFASRGEEAIRAYADALAAGKRFDMVFMDLTIPGGMGGKDAVAEILRLDGTAKVVVSSGYSNDPVMADHERYGFCGLLAKPFTLEDVIKVVRWLAPAERKSPL